MTSLLRTSSYCVVFWTTLVLSSGLGAAEMPPAPEGAFSIVALPDTQNYASAKPATFHAETQWIVDNLDAQKIAFVTGLGDIVETYSVASQWEVAQAAYDRVHGLVPYGLGVGNHDMEEPTGDTSMFQQYFPASRFSDFSWYGGQFGNNVNSYQLFSAGGEDYVALHITCNAPDDALAWADGVFEQYADRQVIVTTHMYLGPMERPYVNEEFFTNPRGRMLWKKCYGTAGNTPQQMWQKCFQKHENLAMILCGDQSRPQAMHRTVRGLHGNTVHEVLSDYREGYLRVYTFLPDSEAIQVTTYSPTLEKVCTGTTYVPNAAEHVFTLQPAPGLPSLSTVVVANIEVDGDTTSTTAAVAQSTGNRVTLANVAKGSFEPALDGAPISVTKGVLIATPRANEVWYPPASAMRYPTIEVGRAGPSGGGMTLTTMKKGAIAPEKISTDTAMAWFSFEDGWVGAHVNADGTVASGGGVDNSMITYREISNGDYGPAPAYEVILPDAEPDAGMLFVVGSSTVADTAEQSHVASTMAIAGGWRVSLLHNDQSTYPDQTFQSEFSFVYIPYCTEGLVAAHIKAEDGSVLGGHSVGDYTMVRTGYGTFELTVDGYTPDEGILLLSPLDCHPTTDMPQDDWVTYAPSEDGQKFVIWTRDLDAAANVNSLTPTDFVFAFIPMAEPPLAGDLNGDGFVGGDDLDVVRSFWGQAVSPGDATSGDPSGDGFVGGDDLDIIRANWGNGDPPVPISVPEPAACVSLLGLGWACFVFRR